LSLSDIKFRTFLDASVPDSVGEVLGQRGHVVIYHRDVLPEKTPDPVVAAAALANDAILVAIDHDMKQLAQRYGMTPRGDRFARLSLIRLCCDEVLASKRLSHAMTFVEHEWAVSEEKAARRMWVDIGAHFLRSNR
jgi:predicted nuclease of predicted toxin-antitoxin system